MSVATLPKQAVDQLNALSKKAEDLTIETFERFAESAAKVTAKLPVAKLPFSIPSAGRLIELSFDAAEDVLAASKSRTLRVVSALTPEAPPAKPTAVKATVTRPATRKPAAPRSAAAKAAKPAARKPAARKPSAQKAGTTTV